VVESPDDDLRDWLGGARALLAELIEEGVDGSGTAGSPGRLSHPTPEAATSPRVNAESDGKPSGSTPRVEGRSTNTRSDPPKPSASGSSPTCPGESPVAKARAAGSAVAGIDEFDRPTLESIREALGDCRRCGLCEGRRSIVFGSGNPDADILFVGEGPGETEDLQGLPFVGRAGELLTQMIEKGMGIPRSQVYICNIVKCRPPNNRNPLPPEVSACRPFLDGQIAAVRPKVIVSLGKPAASLLLGRDVAITRVRGQWHEYRGTPLIPTLHPAFVLRQYTPENRRAVWEDLMAALERSRQG
jgi:uracil-DNA glycosylase family 4